MLCAGAPSTSVHLFREFRLASCLKTGWIHKEDIPRTRGAMNFSFLSQM